MGGRPTLELRPTRQRRPRPDQVRLGFDLVSDLRTTQELPCLGAAPPAGPLRLGEWLVRRGVLSRAQLLRALTTSHQHDWRLGDAVVVLGLAPRAQVEAEVRLLERVRSDHGPAEQRRSLLERRARRLEREHQTRRVRLAAAAAGRLQG